MLSDKALVIQSPLHMGIIILISAKLVEKSLECEVVYVAEPLQVPQRLE